eukprot:TRINITY_DN3173_c0_g1_i1.p1 TRINITY_DN3173_c0_g1~~TRINITY_DN3173_c0_g1_i1.p1  ORF type:complete len:352 (+),score=54.05 TRINITY_DN3173_c0_g1_i1:28-1056(+)
MADMTGIWQDREIHFDVKSSQMAPRKGEIVIDSINSVEDTKGNNGERGSLSITNLRLIWNAHRNVRTNLSIGYSCVQSITIRTVDSRLRGTTQALYVMTKDKGHCYEFIFTSLVRGSPRLFTTIQAVYRAYETSKLYRDLKLRGAIVKNKQLLMLPHEQIYNTIDGVWNLSSDQGNLGTFFITNVRIVWFAQLAENFNVSIPYLQMKSIKIRESKFGPALVVEASPKGGGYILGFRVDPADKLKAIYKEVLSLHKVFSQNPIFGVDFEVEEKPETIDKLKVENTEDDIEIVDEVQDNSETLAAYYADASKGRDREPVYSEVLGLAIEEPPEGLSEAKLWSVL